jgi:hypothetical protein
VSEALYTQEQMIRTRNENYKAGVQDERERIIKLLEDAMCKGSKCMGACWSCQIRTEQIALIKGENK